MWGGMNTSANNLLKRKQTHMNSKLAAYCLPLTMYYALDVLIVKTHTHRTRAEQNRTKHANKMASRPLTLTLTLTLNASPKWPPLGGEGKLWCLGFRVSAYYTIFWLGVVMEVFPVPIPLFTLSHFFTFVLFVCHYHYLWLYNLVSVSYA